MKRHTLTAFLIASLMGGACTDEQPESGTDTTAATMDATGTTTDASAEDSTSAEDMTTSEDATETEDASQDATAVEDTMPEDTGQEETTVEDVAEDEETAVASKLETLLETLAADPDAAMQAQSDAEGWPAPVEGGYLFVTTEPAHTHVAGDHDAWAGTQLQEGSGFRWAVLDVPAGSRYKFTDLGSRWDADPWSRAYHYDEFGVMSQVPPTEAHLERFFNVTDGTVPPRRVRVWLPEAASAATHVLYVHDGQNLFDPGAIGGGWKLNQSAPATMMLVGIDNIGAGRMDEYTPVTDDIGDGAIGGGGDAYADFIQLHVRALIREQYGEPAKVGTMGSSLGGLIAFHIAHRYPDEYAFAASLSGTMGWGSFGPHNETLIERYDDAGKRATRLYLDSGGSVEGACADTDGDGIEDDANDFDNYCTNKQLEAVLVSDGYVSQSDVWHWWEPDAPHHEAAWAARVFRPLEIFAGL